MEKIASFTIDHMKLLPGVYVSRKDMVGESTITTFDLRMTSPNEEPVMNTAEMHTIEHLAATYLRNDPAWKANVLYFGPMGCRTGFYLLMRDTTNEEAYGLVKDILKKTATACLQNICNACQIPSPMEHISAMLLSSIMRN